MSNISKKDEERFWSWVNKGEEHECWEWGGYRDKDGYGHFSLKNKDRRAHRIAWEINNGPIPDGIFVCHHCDNPPCCNAKNHLFLSDNQGNMDDSVWKGRQSKGSNLPTDTVNEIVRLRKAGETYLSIATKCSVAVSTAHRIVRLFQ